MAVFGIGEGEDAAGLGAMASDFDESSVGLGLASSLASVARGTGLGKGDDVGLGDTAGFGVVTGAGGLGAIGGLGGGAAEDAKAGALPSKALMRSRILFGASSVSDMTCGRELALVVVGSARLHVRRDGNLTLRPLSRLGSQC